MSNEITRDVVHMHDVRFTWSGKRGFSIRIDDFAMQQGERLLLLGPSGSGKSTLLSLLAGIVTPQAGNIEVLGTDIVRLGSAARDHFRAENFGIIFQMFNLLPYGAVMDNVVLPLSFAPNRCQKTAQAGGAQAEARRLLNALGLDQDLHDSPASQLSVGQQQRVAVARALIGAPKIIIADEPTSALDRDHQHAFLELLFSQVEHADASLIMVSHEETHASRFGRVAELNNIFKLEAAS